MESRLRKKESKDSGEMKLLWYPKVFPIWILMKIGPQIRNGKNEEPRKKKLKEIFQRYHLKEEVEEKYPFELSGGMSRRILISTAMIENPQLVIADEPTPGLDLAMAKRAMSHFRELADSGSRCSGDYP